MKKKWLLVAGSLSLLLGILAGTDISPQTIMMYTPENPILAAIVILVLYAVKSLSVFFPVIVLQVAVGMIFPTWQALFVNFLGMAVVLTIPFRIGQRFGAEHAEKIAAQYPRFGAILNRKSDNSLFLCFFLRIISLPVDIGTMYLGSRGMPYKKSLCGGLLGTLPRLILATLLGANVQDPSSPAFWIFAALTILMSVGSLGGYYFYQDRLNKVKQIEMEMS